MPVKAAESVLKTEIASGGDASQATLAAIALAKLGKDEAIKAIEANVFSSHAWVRDKAKEYLKDKLLSEPSRRKQQRVADLLRRISRKRAL